MIIYVLHCPHCHSTDVVRHGTTRQGKQRYRCRQCRQGRGRTFLLDDADAGQSPEVKQQIIDMAMNASGVCDTARVWHVSPTTVIKEFKKRTGAPPGESGEVSDLDRIVCEHWIMADEHGLFSVGLGNQ